MIRWTSLLFVTAAAMCTPAAGQTPTPGAATRGQLLYATHCIACHDAKLHWRDRRLATDWPALKGLVRKWQAADRLDWSEADIVEVTRHLNDTFYGFPQTTDRVSLAAPAR